MRILLVSSEFPPGPGGIGRHAADLSLALASRGYLVDVYSNIDYVAQDYIYSFENELPSNIKLHHFKRLGILTYPLRILRVINALRLNRYSRIIFTGKFPLWTGAIIKYLFGRKRRVEFFVHGSEVNPGGRLDRALTHWSLKKADVIWSVSKFTKSILPLDIQQTKNINILPNGVHYSSWPQPDYVILFNEWKGYPKLLTVGSISPRKGQHRVINALPNLLKLYPDIHYHIVGMDTIHGYLNDLIDNLKLTDHVTLHGRLPGKSELARAYNTSDIFMMLSENQPDGDVEGFGIAILEANIYGLPAIGALGCGIEDAISPGVNGELVNGDDPEAITKGVVKMLEQSVQYRGGSKNWVMSHDWNILIDDFLRAV